MLSLMHVLRSRCYRFDSELVRLWSQLQAQKMTSSSFFNENRGNKCHTP